MLHKNYIDWYLCIELELDWFEMGQDSERVEVFYKAAETQTDIMVKNILGQGIDIHLLGLRELARENKCPQALQLFDDPSYMRIQHFALSTSQVRTLINNYISHWASWGGWAT